MKKHTRFLLAVLCAALLIAIFPVSAAGPVSTEENVETVQAFLSGTPDEWADYFADGAKFYSGSYSEYDYQSSYTEIQDWLDSLADDFRYENPYPVEYIFTRVEVTEGASSEYRSTTGHAYADQGYTHNYFNLTDQDTESSDPESKYTFAEGDFADTVVVKTSGKYTQYGAEVTRYYCLFFYFDEDGEIMAYNVIDDTSAEEKWLSEYEANTYAASVGDTVYTGLGEDAEAQYQDVYDSVFDDYDSLLTANLSTVSQFWNAAGEYRGWLRYLLATEDATKAVSQLFFNASLFDYNGHSDETDLYYDTEYEIGTLAGNRVNEVDNDGWLYALMEDENGDPYIQFERWGWYTDNRVYTCINDPNLILCDNLVSPNSYYDRMLVSLTMKDGLIRDLRESTVFGVRSVADPGTDDPEPSDPGTDDPEPSDPGTDDPEPSDPGTDDPEPSDPGTDDPEPVELPFTDVKASDWFYSAVAFTYERGLFNGTTDTTFSPNVDMDRGMFVTVLGRLAEDLGLDVSGGSYPFTDVEESAYYAPFLAWAYDNELITGYSQAEFGPADPVTREQMAAIIIRFSDYLELELSDGNDFSFPDEDEISDWAYDDVKAAVEAGILDGSDENGTIRFLPQGTSTRAQVAQMLQNFIETYLD